MNAILFLLERCETLVFSEKIIVDSLILGKIAEALRHPCNYLTNDYQGAYSKAMDSMAGRAPRSLLDSSDDYNFRVCQEMHKYAWITVVKFNDSNGREVMRIRAHAVIEP